MRRFFWGLVILILWNTFCVYWFVCGLKGLCEQPVTPQIHLVAQPKSMPISQPVQPTPSVAEDKSIIESKQLDEQKSLNDTQQDETENGRANITVK